MNNSHLIFIGGTVVVMFVIITLLILRYKEKYTGLGLAYSNQHPLELPAINPHWFEPAYDNRSPQQSGTRIPHGAITSDKTLDAHYTDETAW